MKKILSLLGCVALFLAVSGASGCDESSSTVDITIFHTNDIHSHFRSEHPGTEENPFDLGGLARLKTLVDQMRKEKPNSLLLDAGDFSEGTGYYFVDAGSNMMKIMDKIGYDAVTVGNHDFLNGPSELASAIERANPKFPLLGANKNLGLVPDKERVEALVKDYVIIEKAGIKIGIIGLLCDDALFYPFFKPGIVTNAVEAASKIAKKLHDEKLADVIILLSHNSIRKQPTVAKQVPWIDAIVSGHSHDKLAKPIEVKNAGRSVYVVEAKQWAQFLGELTLTFDKKSRQVKLKNYRLIPVSSAYKDDPEVATMIDESERALEAKYGRNVHDHVADCEFEMDQDSKKESIVGNLVTDAYREATDADFALETVLLTSTMLVPGPVSMFDLMNLTPYIYHPVASGSSNKPFPEFGNSWLINRVTVSGRELRALLSVVFLADSVGIPLGWIATSGITAVYTKSDGAGALQQIKIFDKSTGRHEPVRDDQEYVMAVADGLLLALTEITTRLHMSIDLSRRENTGIQTWQALLSLAVSKQTLRAEDYAPGSRFNTADADPGVYMHNLKVEKKNGSYVLNVTVQNYGLKAAPAGIVVVASRNNPNDVAYSDTDQNVWTDIGSNATLPALNPGQRVTVELPWINTAGPGTYAVGARLYLPDGFKDGNDLNNVAKVYTTIDVAKVAPSKPQTPPARQPSRKGS